MRTVSMRLADLSKTQIRIGYEGENLHTTVLIDCKKVFDEYPGAAASLTVQPPAGAAYPAVVTRDGDIVEWEITDSDLIHEGDGEIQLAFTVGEVVVKTAIGSIRILRSIMAAGEIPDPLDDFLTRAGAALTAIPETIDAALEAAKESGEFDGYSPTVDVTEISGGHRVSVTDKEGTETFDVMDGVDGRDGQDGRDGIDGKDGKDGKDGADGADGYSPTVDVTEITGGHRVSVTDAEGTETFDVMDGEDGEQGEQGETGATPVISIGTVSTLTPGSSATATMDTTDPEHPVLSMGIPEGQPGNATIDDTAGEGDTTKVWSADKTSREIGEITSPSFIASNADEVLSDRGNTDKTPYLFRKTGGNTKAYNRELLKKVVGGTVAWNQICINGNFATKSDWTESGCSYSVSNNVATMIATAENGRLVSSNGTLLTNIMNHVCVAFASIKGTSGASLKFGSWYGRDYYTAFTANGTWQRITKWFKPANNNGFPIAIIDARASGWDAVYIKDVIIFDLTKMFGSTIADYIYTLETGTAGAGVAFFRKLFPNDYYAYDAGSLKSVKTSGHKTVGFNAWNGSVEISKRWYNGEFIPTTNTFAGGSAKVKCLPNTTYCIFIRNLVADTGLYIQEFDANENWIRQKAYVNVDTATKTATFETDADTYYFALSFYRATVQTDAEYSNICINISDSAKNGTYEPYSSWSYPIDDVELRGIPKLDSNNVLYYDGDEYTADGTVRRTKKVITLTGSETVTLATNNYIKSDACDGYIAISGVKNDTIGYAIANKVLLPESHSIWSTEGYPNTFRINGGTQLHLNIANGLLGITDYTQETTTTAANKIKAYLKGLYDAGQPIEILVTLAAPTTESADPFRELQICSRYGTEEFIDAEASASPPTRDVSIPVGTETFYPVNVFDYIEELTQPDHDMVADGNITSGSYFMIGNTLYLATQAIAQGAAIVPGTNCTETNLAAALNAVNA